MISSGGTVMLPQQCAQALFAEKIAVVVLRLGNAVGVKQKQISGGELRLLLLEDYLSPYPENQPLRIQALTGGALRPPDQRMVVPGIGETQAAGSRPRIADRTW